MKRVGFWLSEKKMKKLDFDSFAEHYKSTEVSFVRIDLSRSLEDQGHFDVIVHKFIELVVLADIGSAVSKKQLEYAQSYMKAHPETILIDPMDKMIVMLSRERQISSTVKVVQHPELRDRVFVPAFCSLGSADSAKALERVKQGGLTFPIVCKPELAHGANQAHQMSIMFNEKNLQDISGPCVLQSFINHNAKLYKVFVVGTYTHICERPSIKNLKEGDLNTLYFHTHEVSKDESDSVLNELDDADKADLPVEPDYPLFRKIARICRAELNLDLFGVDIIMCTKTRTYAIIDVNSFPGYEKMPGFFGYLDSLVRHKLNLPRLNDIDGFANAE